MSVSNPIKTISKSSLSCGDTATVSISFDAAPELSISPADIVLIMDRSGSMGGAAIAEAKLAAKNLVATVASASGSSDGTSIENSSRLSLVSFADTALENTGLIADVAALNTAIDSLQTGGFTNHTAAFEAAASVLSASASARKIAIMFTDGNTTVGGDPIAEVESMKAQGIEIYCIGLLTNSAPLKLWASDPDSTHVATTDDVKQLQTVFADVAAEVVLAGALDMNILEVLNPDFKITNVNPPSRGVAAVENPQTINWTALHLGTAGPETVTLSFDIMHIGSSSGIQDVNESLTYSDRQGAQLVFPNPQVDVACGSPTVIADPCPLPSTLTVDGCRDAIKADINGAVLSGLGRIVQVDTVIKNVCPDKQVAVAVVLTELDDSGLEHKRGSKSFLIPAQGGTVCRDVLLKCVNFVVPESLSLSGVNDSICNPRGFRTRVFANYVDTDFVCCDPQTVLL